MILWDMPPELCLVEQYYGSQLWNKKNKAKQNKKPNGIYGNSAWSKQIYLIILNSDGLWYLYF